MLGDPGYYNGVVTIDEMMAELANPSHVPWFQQAYNKYVEGQRFASQIHGTATYSGITLGNRRQGTKLSELQRQMLMIQKIPHKETKRSRNG